MDLASQEIAPNNVVYDRQEKAYLATTSFVPVITSPSAHSFLNQIRQVEAGMLNLESTFLGWYPPSGVVRHPTRKVDPELLRSTLQAIRRRESLSISYQSMHSVDPSTRDISPHAIAFDGIRWHVRAFCFQHNEFRDFVFARILSFNKCSLLGIDPQQDLAWSTMIHVVIKPNPELSIGQQRAVELDYDMKDGSLQIEVREALLVYTLTQLAVTAG